MGRCWTCHTSPHRTLVSAEEILASWTYFQAMRSSLSSLVVLLMLSWMVHGVSLTLTCLKHLKLHGVTVAFIPMRHRWLELFHLNPRWIWSCPYSTSCVGCWLSQGSIWAVSLSKWVMLWNSIITLWWCSCSRAQDKYLGRKLPYDDSSGHTCFVTKGASMLAFHFGPGVAFETNLPNDPVYPAPQHEAVLEHANWSLIWSGSSSS